VIDFVGLCASPRRFPPPGRSRNWTPALRDHNGQQLAYVYFEDEPGAAFGGQGRKLRP
jgi:hypothetical protein